MAFVERGIGTRKALSLIGLSPGSYYRKAVGLRRGRPADATTCKDLNRPEIALHNCKRYERKEKPNWCAVQIWTGVSGSSGARL
jgi:hypothetical protein